MVDTADHVAFRDHLIDSGWLRRTSVDGVIARTAPFVAVERGIDAVVTRAGADQDATVLRFPPLFPRESYLRTDYLASFPNLSGSIHTFEGSDRDAAALLAKQAAGEDWGLSLVTTDLMLVSASCHPAYELFSGQLESEAVRLDIEGWCFRREPSPDPARAQSFRQREFVYIGTPDGAQQHRDEWVKRGLAVMDELGLPAVSDIANDPFFGRAGRLMSVSQRELELKIELLVPVFGDEDSTACASINYHQDHFGELFGIHTPDGERAHSSCIGFGLERCTVALFAAHGTSIAGWPEAVRVRLWG